MGRLWGMNWVVVDSPVGRLLVIATQKGVVRLEFLTDDIDVQRELHRTAGMLRMAGEMVPPADEWLEGVGLAQQAATELGEYFLADRKEFDVPVYRALSKGFRRQALEHISTIPYGMTESYAEVAEAINNPKAVRAVGGACASNPVPIIVPCHRVLRADRSLGGYMGGQGNANLSYKIHLLDLEGAEHARAATVLL